MAYLGIVEGTRVKRAGFAYRATYEEVLARYRMLSKCTWPPKDCDAKTAVTELLKAVWVIPKPKDAGALGVGLAPTAAAGGGAGRSVARGRGRGRGAARGGAVGAGRGKRPVAAAGGKPGAPVAQAAAAPAQSAQAAAAPTGTASPAAAPANGEAMVKGAGGALPGDIGGPGTYQLKEGVDYQLGSTKVRGDAW